MHHPGPEARQFQQVVVGDPGNLAGVLHQPGVGCEDPFDVGVDLTDAGLQHRGEGHRGGVAAAAAERGDVEVGVNSLEPGGDDDLPRLEGPPHPFGRDRPDPRLRERVVGHDANLGAGHADRRDPQLLHRHRHQGDRLLLSRREQHVHLAGGGGVGNLFREIDQFVGLVPPGTHHHDHLMPRAVGFHGPPGGGENLLGSGDAGATKLLNNDRHEGAS